MLMPLLKSTITKWHLLTPDFARREYIMSVSEDSNLLKKKPVKDTKHLCTHFAILRTFLGFRVGKIKDFSLIIKKSKSNHACTDRFIRDLFILPPIPYR